MAIPAIPDYELPGVSDLPPAAADWLPQADRMALLIHDMQTHFLKPFGVSHTGITRVVANIAMLAARCRQAGVPVFYTAQRGGQQPADRGLQRFIWGPGMADDGTAPGIVEALSPGSDDVMLVKHRYSALARSPLAGMMEAAGRDQLVITGVYAQIGCLATALDAFMADIQPFIVSDAVAGFSRESHDLALKYLADYCGVPMPAAGIMEVL